MKKKGEQKLVKFLFGKAKEFCERLKLSLFKKGRPKVYPDYVIVFALLLKVLENLSLRELEAYLKEILSKVPRLHYFTLQI